MKHKVVAFMPIRLNSQRIKNKSIQLIAGRPMFCWSLETLDNLGIPVYVFTNETDKLKSLLDFNPSNVVWLERPEYLDSSDTKGLDIYKEFSKKINSEIYLLVHCTSPFTAIGTYKKCIDAVLYDTHLSSLTVKKQQTFIWYNERPLNFSFPRQKTQDLTPIFIETSAAYCFKKEILSTDSRTCKNPKLVLTEGIETIDIDEQSDLKMINAIFKRKL